jgi:hypothetical protein
MRLAINSQVRIVTLVMLAPPQDGVAADGDIEKRPAAPLVRRRDAVRKAHKDE